jgi:hypothetical protein
MGQGRCFGGGFDLDALAVAKGLWGKTHAKSKAPIEMQKSDDATEMPTET